MLVVLVIMVLIVDVGRGGAAVLMLGLRHLLLVVLASARLLLLVVVVDGAAGAHLSDRAAQGRAADRLVGRDPHSSRVGRLASVASRPPRLHPEVPPHSVLGIRVERGRGHGIQRVGLRSIG